MVDIDETRDLYNRELHNWSEETAVGRDADGEEAASL